MSRTFASILAALRIETRRSVALLLSPLILAVAWWMAWNGMYGTMPRDIYLWQETSRVVKDSILQIGPLVAGLSAWAAGRNRRRGMEDLLASTPRPVFRRDLTTWGGVALPAVAVYVLLIVLLGIPTALYATWGVPLPGYLLVGLIALLMDSALGFVAGYYMPGRFTAPLVAIALYVVHLLPMGLVDLGINFTLLSPSAYSNLIGADPFYEQPRLALQQSLLFGGIGSAALATVALKGRSAYGKARIALAASLGLAAVGLSLALATEDYESAGSDVVPFAYTCKEGKITVCVHPAYEKFLPGAARTVNDVAEPLVGIPGVPRRALQFGGQGTPRDGVAKRDVILLGSFDPQGHLIEEEVASALVQDETTMYGPNTTREGRFTQEDLQRCGKVPYRHKKYFDPAYEAQAVVTSWLTGRTGGRVMEMLSGCPNFKELVDSFAALPPEKREAWLRENFADLRAGKATLKDLP